MTYLREKNTGMIIYTVRGDSKCKKDWETSPFQMKIFFLLKAKKENDFNSHPWNK